MRRPFFAPVFVLGLGVTNVAADGLGSDPSTWRWTTTMALDAQRAPERSSVDSEAGFLQRHERYSYNGQIDARY